MKLSFSPLPLNSLGSFLQVTTVTALFLSYPTILLAKTNQEISPNTVVTSIPFASPVGVVSKVSIGDRSLSQVNQSKEQPPVPETPGGPRG